MIDEIEITLTPKKGSQLFAYGATIATDEDTKIFAEKFSGIFPNLVIFYKARKLSLWSLGEQGE